MPLALLSGCATSGRDKLVWIGVDGDNSCIVDVDGRLFSLPGEEEGLGAHLRRVAATGAGAVMGERPERTSFGCWDQVMALARRARFSRLGYLSDQPPPAEPVI